MHFIFVQNNDQSCKSQINFSFKSRFAEYVLSRIMVAILLFFKMHKGKIPRRKFVVGWLENVVLELHKELLGFILKVDKVRPRNTAMVWWRGQNLPFNLSLFNIPYRFYLHRLNIAKCAALMWRSYNQLFTNRKHWQCAELEI